MSSPPSDTSIATLASSSKGVSSPSTNNTTIESIKAAHRAEMIADGIVPGELPGPKKRAKKASKAAKSIPKVSKDVSPVTEDKKSIGAADDDAKNVATPETTDKEREKPKKSIKTVATAKKAAKSKRTSVAGAAEASVASARPSKRRKAISPDTIESTNTGGDEIEKPAAKKAKTEKKTRTPKPASKRTPRSKKRASSPAVSISDTSSSSTSEAAELPPALAAKVAQVLDFLPTLPAVERQALFSPGPRILMLQPTDLIAALIAVDADYNDISNVPADSADDMLERIRPMLVDEYEDGTTVDLGIETVFLSGIHSRLEGTGVEGLNVLEVQLRMQEQARGDMLKALVMGTPAPRFFGVDEQGELEVGGGDERGIIQRAEDASGDLFAEAWKRVEKKADERKAAVATEIVEAVVEAAANFAETEKANEVASAQSVVESVKQEGC